jgi:hypothetical protein
MDLPTKCISFGYLIVGMIVVSIMMSMLGSPFENKTVFKFIGSLLSVGLFAWWVSSVFMLKCESGPGYNTGC